jgi:hypothetical protein
VTACAEGCGTAASALVLRCLISVSAKVKDTIVQRAHSAIFTTELFAGWDIAPPFLQMNELGERERYLGLEKNRRKFEVGGICAQRTGEEMKADKCADRDH